MVRDALDAIDKRLRRATESGIGAAGRIAAVREELVTKSRSFTELVDVKVIQAPEGAPIEVKPAQVFAAGSEAIAAAFKLADTASASLGALLGDRVEHLRRDQYVTLAQALCLMVAGVALGFAVTRDVERSARAATAVASSIAKGDLTSTIKVIDEDEIQILVVGGRAPHRCARRAGRALGVGNEVGLPHHAAVLRIDQRHRAAEAAAGIAGAGGGLLLVRGDADGEVATDGSGGSEDGCDGIADWDGSANGRPRCVGRGRR